MVQAPLDQLKDSVARLLRRLAQVQAENGQLKARLSEQQALNQKLQAELTSTGKQLLAQGIAASLPGDAEKRQLRAELDKLIAEIDTLLTSLND